MMRCPVCGQHFDPCTDRFVRLTPMAGRLPGYGWAHRTPSGRGCFYADGGGVAGYTAEEPESRRDQPLTIMYR